MCVYRKCYKGDNITVDVRIFHFVQQQSEAENTDRGKHNMNMCNDFCTIQVNPTDLPL